jgi:ParB family chromosome partitioning protein
VANTLRLLNLPKDIQEGIMSGKISEGHARVILSVEDSEKQRIVFEQIVSENLSVRRTEEIIRQFPDHSAKRNVIPREIINELRQVEEKLRNVFKAKSLTLQIREGKPKLTIEFNSRKEVEELLKKIGE